MSAFKYFAICAVLIGSTAALRASDQYVTALPGILNRAAGDLRDCQDTAIFTTSTARLACVRAVSFADIRKMDLRNDNLSILKRSNGITFQQVRR